MRILYDKWRVPIDDSVEEGERPGALVFRGDGKAVTVRHFGDGRRQPRQEGIGLIKAGGNPRRVTLFEADECGVYRWAFRHVEELEAVSPRSYFIEAHYVVEGESLTVAAEHRSPDDAPWAEGVVRRVEFLRGRL